GRLLTVRFWPKTEQAAVRLTTPLQTFALRRPNDGFESFIAVAQAPRKRQSTCFYGLQLAVAAVHRGPHNKIALKSI
ncbi:hypothetical protein, partial [Chelativorans sp. M5D2P16]|uniref:hypothetical protein n=1 Tax=Chelativorans sp. M5D2P16 TaxID=3095678 RepID=UPI002ACAC19B